MEKAAAGGSADRPGPLTRDPNRKDGLFSASGVFGDARLATRQKGERIVEAAVMDILAEVDAMATLPVPEGTPASPAGKDPLNHAIIVNYGCPRDDDGPSCSRRAPLLGRAFALSGPAPGSPWRCPCPPPAQTPEGPKVSVKDLEGFGKDITEIDLEQMIEEQQSKVGVASARPTTAEQAPGAVTVCQGRGHQEPRRADPARPAALRSRLRRHLRQPGPRAGLGAGRGRDDHARAAAKRSSSCTTGCRLNDDVAGGAFGVNLDIPLDHIRQVEILRGAGAAVYGDAALAAVVSLVSQTTEDFMGTEAGAGFGSWNTQAYRLRSGGILGGLKISGFIRFADSDGARRLVPEDAQTGADAARAAQGLPPISVAPGQARDGLRDLEAAYAFAVRDWTFSFRTKSDRSDGFVGVADNLGRQSQLNSSQLGVDVRWQRTLEKAGTVRAHAGFLRSELGDLLEVYPSGYQVEGDFGTLDLRRAGRQRRRLRAERVQLAALPPGRLARARGRAADTS